MKLLLCVLALLVGCGGGGDDAPSPVVTEGEFETQGGSDSVGASVLSAPLLGPTITSAAATDARICLSGTWVQRLHFQSGIRWSVNFGGATTERSTAAASPVALDLAHCASVTLPPGITRLEATVTVRGISGEPVSSLAAFAASGRWVVVH